MEQERGKRKDLMDKLVVFKIWKCGGSSTFPKSVGLLYQKSSAFPKVLLIVFSCLFISATQKPCLAFHSGSACTPVYHRQQMQPMSLKPACCFCSHSGCRVGSSPLKMKPPLRTDPFVTGCTCHHIEVRSFSSGCFI